MFIHDAMNTQNMYIFFSSKWINKLSVNIFGFNGMVKSNLIGVSTLLQVFSEYKKESFNNQREQTVVAKKWFIEIAR